MTISEPENSVLVLRGLNGQLEMVIGYSDWQVDVEANGMWCIDPRVASKQSTNFRLADYFYQH